MKDYSADLDEIFTQPVLFVEDEEGLWYISPTRGKIRVLEVRLMLKSDDVECINYIKNGKAYSVIKLVDSKELDDVLRGENIVERWRPIGPLVIFILEDGRCLFMDAGRDSTGDMRRLLKAISMRGR